jgi:hypothetical protein
MRALRANRSQLPPPHHHHKQVSSSLRYGSIKCGICQETRFLSRFQMLKQVASIVAGRLSRVETSLKTPCFTLTDSEEARNIHASSLEAGAKQERTTKAVVISVEVGSASSSSIQPSARQNKPPAAGKRTYTVTEGQSHLRDCNGREFRKEQRLCRACKRPRKGTGHPSHGPCPFSNIGN